MPDFKESPKLRAGSNFTGFGASYDMVWGPRITYGLPTIHKLSAQTSPRCLFLLKISGLSAIAVICLPEPRVAVRRRSLSRADLREDFVGAEFYGSGERHYLLPAGAFGFKSAVQFSTTLICPGDCSEALSIRKRWPSGDTS